MPRIGERGWIHSGVKVYDNTAAPTTWTDLDLSAVVGKNRALVFLKFKKREVGVTGKYYLRINGETEEVCAGDDYGCANSFFRIIVDRIIHTLMETDANGIIEWKEATGLATDIWILGYIR